MSRGDFGTGGGGRDLHVNVRTEFGESSDGYPSSQYGESEYIRLSNCVSNNIQQLTNKVSAIQRMANEIGNTYVTDIFEKLRTELKALNKITNETTVFLKQLSRIHSPPAEARQRRIQQDKLQEKFSSVLHNLQHIQRFVVEKEREAVQRARKKSLERGYQNYEHRDTSPMKENTSGDHTFQVLEEADVNIDMIREREDALRQLESDIVDVNEIFKELAIMAHEQGETIDSIEANVDDAQGHIKAANVQLRKAMIIQTSARKKRCCLVVILLLVIIGIVIAIYFGATS